ncbi:MAG: hypothetical protein ACR2OV_02635, partial [Hyphomicrobiaceae bacterium]
MADSKTPARKSAGRKSAPSSKNAAKPRPSRGKSGKPAPPPKDTAAGTPSVAGVNPAGGFGEA